MAVSVTVIAPARAPFCVGVKVTLMVQLECAATLPPQVFVSAKSSLGTTLTAKAELKLLVRVAVLGELVVPTVVFANANEDGFTRTCALPVPVKVAV